MDFDSLMDFASRTAADAGAIALRGFGAAAFELKGDGSEVTAYDRSAEELIRSRIAAAYPADGIVGEESGEAAGSSGRRWIVDPIDATRSFAAGVPLFGVLIALEAEGEPVLGCCHLPALGHTLVAARGAGAWLDGRRAAVSDVDDLSEARVVTSGLEYWRDWATDEGRDGFTELVATSRFARTWGDCYGYFLIATGRAEIMADPAVGAIWDYAPMVPILAEAGGRFTSLGDSPVHAWSSGLATNGRLHARAAACWNGAADDRLQTEVARSRHP